MCFPRFTNCCSSRTIMPFYPSKFAVSCLLVVASSFLTSCGGQSSEDVKNIEQTTDNLRAISDAYKAATNKLGRPPADPQEITKFLPSGVDANKVFKSPNDGESFVIFWGTDIRNAPVQGTKPLIVGYEKNGKDGSRMVFTTMGVVTMNDEQFASGFFPPGHQPN